MIHLKSDAVGFDKSINRMINKLNKHVNTYLGYDFEIYHKIYRNKLEVDGNLITIPEALLSNGDYREIFINDKYNGIVGFLPAETREVNGSNAEVEVDVIFSVKMDTIFDTGQREDEKMLLSCKNAVDHFGFEVTEIKTGLENVYSGFDTSRINFRDMNPWFNFSFTILVIYENICDYDL